MHSIIDSILIQKCKMHKTNVNDCARRPQRPLLLLPLQLTRTRTRARARTHTHTQQATSTTSTPTTPPNAAGPTSPHRRTARRRRPGTATASRRRGACSTCTRGSRRTVRTVTEGMRENTVTNIINTMQKNISCSGGLTTNGIRALVHNYRSHCA